MRIINRLKQMGIVISFAELMEKPYIEKWWEILSERMSLEDALSSKILISKESNSLTDVQYAYWIGRGEKQILGGVSCHAYFEFKGLGLDTDKLKEAWYKIQQRHPMLRARFLENGTQQIIEQNKFSNELIIYDLREKQSEIEEHLLKIRTTNSHRIFDIEKGHVAALEVTIINNKEYVIHFDIDLLVADLKSIGIVLNDLAALYGDKYLPKLPNNINFMNRVVNTNQSDYVKDREYWNQKMDDIPGMPELPICKKIIQIKKPVFKRRNFFLDENKWKYLLEICAFRQVTPAMVLLSLYAEVLGKFSNSSRFLINVPLFGRPLDEENIDFVVGDFTNILLLPIDISGKNQFIDQVNNITDIFMEAMKHTSYSGVEVIRDLLKKDTGNKLIAPVVFSCNYDEVMVPVLFEKKLGKLDYISTQTPQVLIDFQILKMTEGILFSWDVVDEAFCEGTIDTMFDCYMKALEDLIEQPDSWNKKIEFMELFNMSHDIRTPMNAIIGYAELGEKHLKEPTILEDYFEKILLCGKKMLHLIDNILELARIENNQATLDETITDVSKNFDLCIDMFRKQIEEKHQTLKVNKNIRYPYLHMDDARSSEITINILSNAVKYTGEGGNISCTLNQYPGEKEGWSVLELIIADNGIGMSEEFQKHIFESFSQERSSSDSGIEGSGLGMGIVKKLVDLMNGKITVQSKPGAGSTFTITLPLKIANAEERNPKHADGQLNIKKLEGKRVLLVEDNDLNAEIATELLTEEGIMIERAENGVACIDMFNKAKQNYYSLILMDIQMPIMNGYEASRRIRELKDGNKSQIPIVAMTANAFEEDKKMALASGMNDHVAKPIDMNVLLPTIMKYM